MHLQITLKNLVTRTKPSLTAFLVAPALMSGAISCLMMVSLLVDGRVIDFPTLISGAPPHAVLLEDAIALSGVFSGVLFAVSGFSAREKL